MEERTWQNKTDALQVGKNNISTEAMIQVRHSTEKATSAHSQDGYISLEPVIANALALSGP